MPTGSIAVLPWRLRRENPEALDHVPTDLTDRIAPKLVELYERVKNDARVSDYYAKHGVAAA